jgi:hypothetical protein
LCKQWIKNSISISDKDRRKVNSCDSVNGPYNLKKDGLDIIKIKNISFIKIKEMSQIKRKKQVKKQNTANTIEELIEDINQNNITQSEVIQKIILDDDFNELIRNSPIEEKNKLAEALINTTYFKALRSLKNEYSDIEIFKIMDDIMTYEYIRMLYILNKQRVDDLDIIDMINQGSLEGLTYAYNNGLIVVEKDMIEDAKTAYSKDDSETKLTIYNLQLWRFNEPPFYFTVYHFRMKTFNKIEIIIHS